jgi:uncharacterized protein YceH (UPF0502 family)
VSASEHRKAAEARVSELEMALIEIRNRIDDAHPT